MPECEHSRPRSVVGDAVGAPVGVGVPVVSVGLAVGIGVGEHIWNADAPHTPTGFDDTSCHCDVSALMPSACALSVAQLSALLEQGTRSKEQGARSKEQGEG